MPFEIPVLDITRDANVDLSAAQFLIVKAVAGGKVALAAAGEQSYGILQDKPGSGKSGAVRVYGVSKVVAGAAIAEGDPITSDAAGKAKTAVRGSTNTSDAGVAADPLVGSYVLGIALEPAAALNDVITVLITHAGAVPTTAS